MCKIIQAHFSKLSANFWGKKITNLMIKAVKKGAKQYRLQATLDISLTNSL